LALLSEFILWRWLQTCRSLD